MVLLDTGFFLLTSILATSFMFLSFRYIGSHAQALFSLLSFVMFMTLALFLVSDYQVGTETSRVESDITRNSTNHIISNSTNSITETEYLIDDFTSQSILGYIYLILGLANAGFMIFTMMPSGGKD